MSADNWAVCPKCKQDADKEQKEREQKARKAYGKVTAEEYIELRQAAMNVTELEKTLREDYEMGMDDDGEFWVSYSCDCQTCGFQWSYKHKEKVKP